MMYWLLGPLRMLGKALLSESSPRQLAAGFAMGMVIGFVPKGNLIAVALMTILAASRVNVGVGILSALIFSSLAPWIDPYTHVVGEWLLELPLLQAFWNKAYNTPVVPWTAFNNTVVLGGLVSGLLLFAPAYFLTRPIWDKYTETIVARMKKYHVLKVLLGAEITDRLSSA